jgi:hypothetical protein
MTAQLVKKLSAVLLKGKEYCSTIKTTSFTPSSVIKLHLLFVHAFTCFGLLVNHLQKAHQLFKGNYHYMIHSYNK